MVHYGIQFMWEYMGAIRAFNLEPQWKVLGIIIDKGPISRYKIAKSLNPNRYQIPVKTVSKSCEALLAKDCIRKRDGDPPLFEATQIGELKFDAELENFLVDFVKSMIGDQKLTGLFHVTWDDNDNVKGTSCRLLDPSAEVPLEEIISVEISPKKPILS